MYTRVCTPVLPALRSAGTIARREGGAKSACSSPERAGVRRDFALPISRRAGCRSEHSRVLRPVETPNVCMQCPARALSMPGTTDGYHCRQCAAVLTVPAVHRSAGTVVKSGHQARSRIVA